MPRPLRIEYPGARYHVMCRGNRGSVVFGADDDVRLFLRTFGEAADRTGWRAHAYALMGTHYHLLLETPSANLVEGMKWFQGTFTQRMNAMHRTWGHLFQGRYKAKIIDDLDPSHFRRVADYIHLNPAAAGLLAPKEAPRLSSFTRSSYPFYLLPPSRRPGWLEAHALLAEHGMRDTASGRKAFEALMDLKALHAARARRPLRNQAEWRGMERGWVHGERVFRERMIEHLRGGPGSGKAIPRGDDAGQRREMTELAARGAVGRGLGLLGVGEKDLGGMPKGHASKLLLAAYLKGRYSVGSRWISEALRMGHPSLAGKSRAMVRSSPQLREAYARLEAKLEEI